MFFVENSAVNECQSFRDLWTPSSLQGFRSVITTPQRSRTCLSLFTSRSLSVLPDLVPEAINASFTESWITSVYK
jgi:hypothetical protein